MKIEKTYRNLLVLALTACSAPAPSLQTQPPPNILWITVEDLSPRLAAYGDSRADTPSLNRLASEGMTFTQVFSISGVCAPSRSALITGMYPISIGTHHMRTTHEAPGLPGPYLAVPPPHVKTFTESLRAAGYSRKPVEELYDLQSDPHEIRNLVRDPGHEEILQRLRRALERWRTEVGDMGVIPEHEMIAQMWPGGDQPTTAMPSIHPSGGEFDRPIEVTLSCPTNGASIAYTTEEGETAHWKLYTDPIELTTSTVIRARAVRYGYQASAEARAEYRFEE